jgi:DNA-binding Lrp family transcriptional regulator
MKKLLHKNNYSAIGKEIKRSRAFVKMRVDKLIENKIIKSPYYNINYLNLGFSCILIYFKFNNNLSEKLLRLLKSEPQIEYSNIYVGNYQLGVFFRYKKEEEIMELAQKIRDIQEYEYYELFLIKKYCLFPHNFLYDKICSDNFESRYDLKNPKDAEKILKLVREKVPSSFKFKLIKKYQKLLFSRFPVNIKKLNFFSKNVLIKSAHVNELKKFLLTKKSLLFLAETYGRYQLIIELVFNNMKEFFEIIQEMYEKKLIEDYIFLEGMENF